MTDQLCRRPIADVSPRVNCVTLAGADGGGAGCAATIGVSDAGSGRISTSIDPMWMCGAVVSRDALTGAVRGDGRSTGTSVGELNTSAAAIAGVDREGSRGARETLSIMFGDGGVADVVGRLDARGARSDGSDDVHFTAATRAAASGAAAGLRIGMPERDGAGGTSVARVAGGGGSVVRSRSALGISTVVRALGGSAADLGLSGTKGACAFGAGSIATGAFDSIATAAIAGAGAASSNLVSTG